MTCGNTENSPGMESIRESADSAMYTLPAAVKKIDAAARDRNGTEFFLQSVLYAILRFYKEKEYRKEKLLLYREHVLPFVGKKA